MFASQIWLLTFHAQSALQTAITIRNSIQLEQCSSKQSSFCVNVRWVPSGILSRELHASAHYKMDFGKMEEGLQGFLNIIVLWLVLFIPPFVNSISEEVILICVTVTYREFFKAFLGSVGTWFLTVGQRGWECPTTHTCILSYSKGFKRAVRFWLSDQSPKSIEINGSLSSDFSGCWIWSVLSVVAARILWTLKSTLYYRVIQYIRLNLVSFILRAKLSAQYIDYMNWFQGRLSWNKWLHPQENLMGSKTSVIIKWLNSSSNSSSQLCGTPKEEKK